MALGHLGVNVQSAAEPVPVGPTTREPVRPALDTQRSAPVPGSEVVGLRERFSTTYATDMPNQFDTQLSMSPVHYRQD